MSKIQHPLLDLVELYCVQYPKLREDNLDISSNMDFHRRFGLSLHVPGWPVLNVIREIVSMSRNDSTALFFPKIMLVFSSTQAYTEIYKLMGDDVDYVSWQEVFAGIQISGTDIRYVQKVKNALESADLTFFIDPPDLPEVLDHVRAYTNGCLISLSSL